MTYRGLRAIAQRMGWKSPNTVISKALRSDFPAYLEYRGGNAVLWRTDDALIFHWQLEQARKTQLGYRRGHRLHDRHTRNRAVSPQYAA